MLKTLTFIKNILIHKKSTNTSILITIGFIFLNGCAHQNYMDEGQRFYQNNQYEAAVEQFTYALNEEPDNLNTQNKLANAKNQLQDWATALEPKADIAFENNHLGKALLLYGKSAQITKNPYSVKRYKALYATLRSQSLIHAKILPNKLGFTNSTLNNLDGIIHDNNAQTLLNFSQSNPVFEIQQSTQDALIEYISGSQLIANPDLLNMQNQIQEIKLKQHSYKNNLGSLHEKYRSADKLTNKLSNQLQRVEMLQQATNLSNEKRASYNSQASKIRNQLSNAKSKSQSTQQQITKTKQLYKSLNSKMTNISSRLSHTPAVIEVPVYSDYIYQEFKQTNIMSGVIYLRVNNITRTAAASVSSSDISHPAQPTVNLAANPMTVLSQQQLTPLYLKETYNIGSRLINELIAEQKASFLYKAQDSNDIDNKLTLLVQHGLITHDGASETALTMLNSMLTAEFGNGGIFNGHQLLNLY